MVEVEQEEFERLKGLESKYAELEKEHADLKTRHDTLKDDYISLSKGQQGKVEDNKDDFTDYCEAKFKKK